jgi:hypothetical protein
LAIFFTFGSIYPPLALVVFVHILTNITIIQLYLGRFVVMTRRWPKLLRCIDSVQQEAEAISALVTLSLPTVTVLATPFWAFFLFDILGDDIGTYKALWIFLGFGASLVFIRVAILCAGKLHIDWSRWCGLNVKNKDGNDESEEDFEMTGQKNVSREMEESSEWM